MNWPRLSLLLLLALPACKTPETKPKFSQAQQHGAELYAKTCAVCHGAAAEGYKADRAPAIGNAAYLAAASDDFLRQAIADGRPGSTMSAWSKEHGGPFAPEDVSDIVSFLRTFDRRPRASLDERPRSGNAENGEKVFRAQCAQCHGLGGVGGGTVNVGEPRFLHAADDGFLRDAIRNGRSETPMPGFGGAIGDSGVEDVLAYLRKLEALPPQAQAAALPAPIPLGPVPLNPGGPEPEGFAIPLTGADVIKAQLDRKARLAILDARAPSDYVKEHIAGAVSVPFYDPGPYFSQLPKDAWLVCYCACPHAESGQLAKNLADHGFTKVTVLDEGLNYWKSKGYPTSAGQAP